MQTFLFCVFRRRRWAADGCRRARCPLARVCDNLFVIWATFFVAFCIMILHRRPHSFCSLGLWSACHVLAMSFLTSTHTHYACAPPLMSLPWKLRPLMKWHVLATKKSVTRKCLRNCDVEKSLTARGLLTASSIFKRSALGAVTSVPHIDAHTSAHTHTSCSDMFRLFVLLLFVQPAAREANSRERKEAKGKKTKQKAPECCQNTHTLTYSHIRRNFVGEFLFFTRTNSAMWICLFFWKSNGAKKRKKTKVKRITNLFSSLSPDMNYSPKPCAFFRRKRFLWMRLRGSAQCKKKTKVGAVYFLNSWVC